MRERGEDGGEGKGSCKLALLFFPLVWPYPRTYDEEVLCTNVYGAVQSWAPAMYDLPSSDLNTPHTRWLDALFLFLPISVGVEGVDGYVYICVWQLKGLFYFSKNHVRICVQ